MKFVKDFEDILEIINENNTNLSIIQIGANSGKDGDPLHQHLSRFNSKAILVEPNPAVYKQLMHNYKKRHNTIFENKAIGNKNGKEDLYTISFSQARWATGLSSFYESNVIKHIENGYIERCAQNDNLKPPEKKRNWIKKIQVDCITLETLFKKYKINECNVFCTDTEGFDANIIKQIPFHIIKPQIIYFEHHFFSTEEKQEVKQLLLKENYHLMVEGLTGINIIAIHNTVLEKRIKKIISYYKILQGVFKLFHIKTPVF